MAQRCGWCAPRHWPARSHCSRAACRPTRGQRTRAEEVAYAIGHQPMHEWAMAEVAVGHVRAGDAARAEVVLSTLKTETALAWALAELASDAAHRGDSHAIDRVAALANQRLRDRALAL